LLYINKKGLLFVEKSSEKNETISFGAVNEILLEHFEDIAKVIVEILTPQNQFNNSWSWKHL